MVSAAPIVAFQHVTFAYDAEPVLEDIDFTVMPGDYVAVVGPNGGGKTTLIKLILGVLSPQEGTIHVCGESPRKRQTSIGYVVCMNEIANCLTCTPETNFGSVCVFGFVKASYHSGDHMACLRVEIIFWPITICWDGNTEITSMLSTVGIAED
jgi:ABC-type molybdenum transport system ATPase subunit/photorepair protein PhrA